jgi:hypothetical protein
MALEDEADSRAEAAQGRPAQVRHRLAEHLDAALAWFGQAHEAAKERRLAGAVRSYNRDGLAGADREVEACEDRRSAGKPLG